MMDGPMIYDESVGFVPAHNDAIMTNADRIRAMTDEELAKWVVDEGRYFGEEYEGYMSLLDWLKQEVDR